MHRTARILFAVVALLAALATHPPAPVAADEFPSLVAAAPDPVIANFGKVWSRTDSDQVRGARTFLWGPQPLLPVIDEPLAGAPGGRRAVLYWDKSRMEVNDPAAAQDQWYVTNGLLVSEMVSGRQQIGTNPDLYAERAPADIPFGDLVDPTGPTFASFRGRLADPPLAAGEPVAQALDRAGAVSPTDAGGVACETVVSETRHCIAAPFWAFLTSSGAVYDEGAVGSGALFDPIFYATGLPISEAYWITVQAGGQPARVLIQLFERRTLTYNPANSPDARVEMGNVGLQYYHWRYDALRPDEAPTGLDPAMRAGLNQVWEGGPAYRYLIDNLAGGRFQAIFQDLSEIGAYGAASQEHRALLLDSRLAGQDPKNLGAVLAHEAQHAYDFAAFGGDQSEDECYALEVRGFLVGAAIWQGWYGPNGKPEPANDFERAQNGLLTAARTNPARFVQSIYNAYRDQCAGRGAGGPERLLTLQGLPAGIEGQLPVQQTFDAVRVTVATAGEPALTAAGFDAGWPHPFPFPKH